MNNALYVIGDIIHEIQRERGTACLYAAHGKGSYEESLKKQFRQTDLSLDRYNQALSEWEAEKSLPKTIVSKIQAQNEKLGEWITLRKGILRYDVPAADIINICTDQQISPLINIMVECSFFNEKNQPVCVSAFSNFLQWKENTGRERALGLRGFSTGNFSDRDYLNWLKSQIIDQEASKELFLSLAIESQNMCFMSLVESPVEEQIERINNAILGKIDNAFLSELNAFDWFQLMSQKIDLMHEVEIKLIDTLPGEEKANKESHIELVDDIELKNCAISPQDIQLLSKIPLFNNLPSPIYEELLKHAQIDTHKKGKLLFLEGEQASRIFVILHGWVKLSKGSHMGDEAILQMFSSGDTLAESAVFLNVPLPETAQVVEPSRILTLPAPLLRELIRNSNELAVNMLSSMSRISRNFMRQIECTRLKNSDERVGWFLLKLMLEQSRTRHHFVDLPFDKAVVASYLNMKPETLSRTLKRFKAFGFEVEQGRIRLPYVGALCNYCDTSLAAYCDDRYNKGCKFTKN